MTRMDSEWEYGKFWRCARILSIGLRPALSLLFIVFSVFVYWSSSVERGEKISEQEKRIGE